MFVHQTHQFSRIVRLMLTPFTFVKMWASPTYTDAARQKIILALSAILYFVQPSGLVRLILFGRRNNNGVVHSYVYRALQDKARQTDPDPSGNGEIR